jgi:hypothetical protein
LNNVIAASVKSRGVVYGCCRVILLLVMR